MVDYIELTIAMVETFRKIPEVVAALNNGPESIIPYIDINPDLNQLENAKYEQPPGSIIVVWMGTLFAREEISCWTHHFNYYLRAKRKESPLRLMNLLVDGTPVPGDGRIWRDCPFLPTCLPTIVMENVREEDAEHIDTYVIKTETKETGDAKHA